MTRRKIAVFTGNRAEYGLQFPILKAISKDPRLEYFLIVSGAHLKGDFGRTLEEIKNDGFDIYAKIEFDFPADDLCSTAKAIGTGVLNLSSVLNQLKPDFLVAYADRFESFAAVIASTQMGIATAHIEGGDYTEGGALDDSVRHAMSKLAHLHFTTNELAAERVRKMGEESWRVFNVGYPALDLVAEKSFAASEEIYKKFNLDPSKPILVFTQHSVSTEYEQSKEQIKPSLAALEEAARRWQIQVIMTYPNDDAGGRVIIDEMEKLNNKNIPSIQIHRSLGRYYYYGLLNVAAACIGNSSSGIKETPAFHCASINIGSRQRGRLRADNVLDVDYNKEAILAAIHRSLKDSDFKSQVRNCSNPYIAGNAGKKIANALATIKFGPKLIQKKMTY